MDVHGIQSDLVAMEMELKYHDVNDEEIIKADSKTPKASSNPNYKQALYKQNDRTMQIKNFDKKKSTLSNYVSLNLVKEEAKASIEEEYVRKQVKPISNSSVLKQFEFL